MSCPTSRCLSRPEPALNAPGVARCSRRRWASMRSLHADRVESRRGLRAAAVSTCRRRAASSAAAMFCNDWRPAGGPSWPPSGTSCRPPAGSRRAPDAPDPAVWRRHRRPVVVTGPTPAWTWIGEGHSGLVAGGALRLATRIRIQAQRGPSASSRSGSGCRCTMRSVGVSGGEHRHAPACAVDGCGSDASSAAARAAKRANGASREPSLPPRAALVRCPAFCEHAVVVTPPRQPVRPDHRRGCACQRIFVGWCTCRSGPDRSGS
jgi:hypothetical protein